MHTAVDAHAHVWILDPLLFPWQPLVKGINPPTASALVEDLIEQMDVAGIQQAIVTQPAIYGADNNYLASAVGRYAGRLVGVIQVDQRAPDMLSTATSWFQQGGLKGLRLNPGLEPERNLFAEAGLAQLWRFASEMDVPISLRVAPDQLPALDRLLQDFPQTMVVIDYLGPQAFVAPFVAFQRVAGLAERANLFVKVLPLAGHSREPYPFTDLNPAYALLHQAFGGRRLIWGSKYKYTSIAEFHVSGRGLAHLMHAAHVAGFPCRYLVGCRIKPARNSLPTGQIGGSVGYPPLEERNHARPQTETGQAETQRCH